MKLVKRILYHVGVALLACVPITFMLIGINPFIVSIMSFIAAIPIYLTTYIETQDTINVVSMVAGLFATSHALFHGITIGMSLVLGVFTAMCAFTGGTFSGAMFDSSEELGNSNIVKNIRNAFWNKPKRFFSRLKEARQVASFVANDQLYVSKHVFNANEFQEF